jgi:hypothetical protein
MGHCTRYLVPSLKGILFPVIVVGKFRDLHQPRCNKFSLLKAPEYLSRAALTHSAMQSCTPYKTYWRSAHGTLPSRLFPQPFHPPPSLNIMHLCLTQIQSLARITAGICLFNQAQGRGGAALPPGVASFVPQVRSPLPLVVWGDAPAQVQGGLGCSSALTWESTGVLLMPGHHTPVPMHEKTSRHSN